MLRCRKSYSMSKIMCKSEFYENRNSEKVAETIKNNFNVMIKFINISQMNRSLEMLFILTLLAYLIVLKKVDLFLIKFYHCLYDRSFC